MRTALKVVNWLLVVIIILVSLGVAAEGSSAAESAGMFVGSCFWLLPPALALLALRSSAGKASRNVASIANAILIAALMVLGVVMFDGADLISYALGAFIFSIPAGLNLWGLHKLVKPAPLTLELVDDPPAERPAAGPARPVVRSPSPVVAAANTNGNYIQRHWRGDLSLPVSYWVNGSLLSVVLMVFYSLIGSAVENAALKTVATASIGLLLLLVVATFWSSVGIWRSATHHPSRGGSSGWATTAKFMVVLGMMSFAGTLTNNIGPQLKEYTLIALGNDPLGRIEATISADGQALILKGYFGEGSAERVRALLKAAPGVKTVMLESGGGRLKEAENVAMLVAARGLDTYVESYCESACTYVFLAGYNRAATPNAQIGFHPPSFPGLDEMAEYQMLQQMQTRYRRAGISQAFLDHIADTPSDDMWYPAHDTLVANGVINRISTGGEVASLSGNLLQSEADMVSLLRTIPMFNAYERHFPGILDEAAEAAMSVRAAGGTDAELMNAVRGVIARRMPELLAAANGEQLRLFIELTVDQLYAARAVSDEACELLLDSKLDISKTLPAELLQREFDWALSVLDGPLMRRPPISQAAFDAAVGPLFEEVSPQHMAVLADMTAYADARGLRCDATLELYQAMLNLPEPDLTIAASGMFEME